MIRLAAPLESFFPFEKYSQIRPTQKQAFSELDEFINVPQIRFYFIDAPTGVGKSAIAVTLTRAFKNYGSVILTPTKFLQDEYSENYADIPNIKGRANYMCGAELKITDPVTKRIILCTADSAPCKASGKSCSDFNNGRVPCPYYETRSKAIRNFTFVVNFKYFILAKKFLMNWFVSQPGVNISIPDSDDDSEESYSVEFNVNKRNVLIIDEAHNSAEQVLDNVVISIDKSLFNGMERGVKNFDDYIPLLNDIILNIDDEIDKLERTYGLSTITSYTNLTPHELVALKQKEALRSLQNRISKLISSYYDGVEWLYQTQRTKSNKEVIEFKPVFPAYFVNKYLFSEFSKVFLLSGTFMNLQKMSEELGIAHEGMVRVSIPHPFDVEHRKIYAMSSIGNMRSSLNNNDNWKVNLGKAVNFIGNLIINKYPDKKGIIFTGNYEIQEKLLESFRVNYPDIFEKFLSAETNNKEKIIDQHRKSKKPTIILTASLYEGVDLKDDFSRFQIFVKIPYASLGDVRIKRILEIDPLWYDLQALKKLLQGYGRSIRSERDYADTYILDSAFLFICKKYMNMTGENQVFPDWFKQAIIFKEPEY